MVTDKKKILEIMNNRNDAVYIVSKQILDQWVKVFIVAQDNFPFGGQVKYAMKANPHPQIIERITNQGIGIDASSFYEAKLALDCGVDPSVISLTSQELPPTDSDFIELVSQGVWFNATSLHQLAEFCRLFPARPVGVRVNPGIGSGFNMRLTTGGVSAGFGIWYEYASDAINLAAKSNNTISTVHSHIGAGTDPMEWISALDTTLQIVEEFKDADTVSIGGGFKAKYMPGDHDADIPAISLKLADRITEFSERTGRNLKLEIEPGRLLVVHAGNIVGKVIDLTDTGEDGYRFIRVNTGMTEILRPAMYGSQHQLEIISREDQKPEYDKFVVVGHCCESSDCLTMAHGNPEEIEPRKLQVPTIGDYLVVNEAGAYCYGMSASNYNSFPRAEVVFVD